MKRNIAISVIIGILLSACAAQTATQVVEFVTEVPVTEAPATPAPVLSEPVATLDPVVALIEQPVGTEPPTCVTLLEPINGIDLPLTGKVTFLWTSMDDAESYVLNFLLPSGYTALFETDQTFRDRYMEAFVSGGKYQWQVIARGADGSEICVSEMFAFYKPAYEELKHNDGNSGSEETPSPPIFPPSTGGP